MEETMENQQRDLNERDRIANSVFTLAMRFTSSYFLINSWVIDNEMPTMDLIRHFTTNYWLLRAADRAVIHDALK